jgi:tetratricopeptide (TPR) repeat protein
MRKQIKIMILTMGIVFSQDPSDLFKSGNDSYNNKNYLAATNSYEKILSQNIYNSELYYNLGNAYYKLGDFANARWSYEMGIIIDPRDKDIVHNLFLVKQRIANTLEVPNSNILNIINNFFASFTLQDFIFFSATVLLLMSFSSVIHRLTLSRFILIVQYFLLIIFFFGTTCSVIKYSWDNNSNYGIILNDETQLYSAPFINDNIKISTFFSGNKVKIEQTTNSWIEISSIDGRKGWIRLEDIRTLD